MYHPFCLTAPSSKYPPSLQSQVYMAFSWTYYTRKSAAGNIMKLLRGCMRLAIPQMNLRTVSWQSWSSLWISLWPWPTRSISFSVLTSTRVSLWATYLPLIAFWNADYSFHSFPTCWVCSHALSMWPQSFITDRDWWKLSDKSLDTISYLDIVGVATLILWG